MSLEDIDPQFRLDAEVAPTFVVKNYDIETGEFQVFYNDGSLNNDEWYGPLFMDLDSMKPDHEEPIRFQIAQYVYNAVERSRLAECNMDDSKQVLAQMMGVEQSIDMVELMKHNRIKQLKMKLMWILYYLQHRSLIYSVKMTLTSSLRHLVLN